MGRLRQGGTEQEGWAVCVRFLPKTNFFRGFSAAGRRCWAAAHAGDPRVARIVDAFPDADHRPSGEPNTAFLRVASVNETPFFQNEYERLPPAFRNLRPRAFVVLRPDSSGPAIWIGGTSRAGVEEALDLCAQAIPILAARYLAAADFHVHSRVSDGWAEPEALPTAALRANLDILALTDHDSDAGYPRLLSAADGLPHLLVLRGMELNDDHHNHVLALGDAAGLSRQPAETIVAAAREGRVVIAQAHATSTAYFGPLDERRNIGAEAFNFLSSAPEMARRYLRESFASGRPALALGNSDTHMLNDIGKARTFLLLEAFTPAAVHAELKACRTCAFQAGETVGDSAIESLVRRLYRESDLLQGKLVPAPGPACEAAVQPSAAGPDIGEALPLADLRRSNRRHVYCPSDACDCLEQFYRLPEPRTGRTLVCGRAVRVTLSINGMRRPVTLRTGEAEPLRAFLRPGVNRLALDRFPRDAEPPRLCMGKELSEWDLWPDPGGTPVPMIPATNLQVQQLAPYGGFEGERILRTRVSNPAGMDRLFFESIDGNIRLCVNGRLLATRFGTHWEERFEVPLPPELARLPELEIVVRMRKHVGLSGISNRAFLGRSIPLPACGILRFSLPAMSDLAELRWGEQRTRGFLLDAGFSVLDCFPTDGSRVPIPPAAAWVLQTSFGMLPPPVQAERPGFTPGDVLASGAGAREIRERNGGSRMPSSA